MKKIAIAVAVAALAAMLALGVAGCGKKDQGLTQTPLLGGWQLNGSFEVTADAQALMDKALEGFTGAQYVPCAYVATQVVSGTNHLFVCRANIVVPDAVETWALVTVYEDLDGNVTIHEVHNSGVETHLGNGMLAGGWYEPETPDIDEELAGTLAKATEGWTGSKVEPVALLSQQVVAGMNYLVLAQVTAVAADAQPDWMLVTVYADLQGNATITDMAAFDAE